MKIALRDVEPFNVPPVDNQEAAQFLRRVTGGETFDWFGDQPPRCMMLYFVTNDSAGRSCAQGVLFPFSIDEFERVCSVHRGTMDDIFKKYGLGSIRIEYGAGLAGVTITATTSLL